MTAATFGLPVAKPGYATSCLHVTIALYKLFLLTYLLTYLGKRHDALVGASFMLNTIKIRF